MITWNVRTASRDAHPTNSDRRRRELSFALSRARCLQRIFLWRRIGSYCSQGVPCGRREPSKAMSAAATTAVQLSRSRPYSLVRFLSFDRAGRKIEVVADMSFYEALPPGDDVLYPLGVGAAITVPVASL